MPKPTKREVRRMDREVASKLIKEDERKATKFLQIQSKWDKIKKITGMNSEELNKVAIKIAVDNPQELLQLMIKRNFELLHPSLVQEKIPKMRKRYEAMINRIGDIEDIEELEKKMKDFDEGKGEAILVIPSVVGEAHKDTFVDSIVWKLFPGEPPQNKKIQKKRRDAAEKLFELALVGKEYKEIFAKAREYGFL